MIYFGENFAVMFLQVCPNGQNWWIHSDDLCLKGTAAVLFTVNKE